MRRKPSRWAGVARERTYGHYASLSSSVESLAFAGAPLSPLRGSFPLLARPRSGDTSPGGRARHVRASLKGSRSEGSL